LPLLILVAGCGQGTDRPVAKATPTPSPKPTVVKTRISITTPHAGAELEAGTVAVAGRATAGTTVLLSAGCFKPGCQAVARADGHGRWKGRLRVTDRRTVLEASSAGGDARDRVTVAVSPPPRPTSATGGGESEPVQTPAPRPTRVVLIGDSLAVGIRSLLPRLLPGYSVSANALTSRPMAAGMAIVDRTDVTGAVLAISLFTNDDPRNVDGLEAAVRRTLAAVGPHGCAVWATISRPPFGGVSYRAANGRLAALEAELSPRLILVPWAETVAAQPELLASDHVHGTPAGYQARAALYAQAIASCGG
jgi:hypothetical protein